MANKNISLLTLIFQVIDGSAGSQEWRTFLFQCLLGNGKNLTV